MESPARHSMIDRMRGAAALDVPTYEEVESDTTATGQAAGVVVIVAVASAIGGLHGGARGVIAGIVSAVVGWLVWAGITYLIGTRLFHGTATWGELLRTLGFAQSPGVLLVLGLIPILGRPIQFLIWIWLLVAGIVGIRQALDFDTGKAIFTAVLGWLVILVFQLVLFA